MTGSVAFRETQRNHLRFDQIRLKRRQMEDLETSVNPPPHLAKMVQIANVPAARKRLAALRRAVERGTPKPYAPTERDLAVARQRELEDEIRRGMPTSVEMRRNLPGSERKHTEWERARKDAILEWKAIKRRLHATEVGNGEMSADGYMANVEDLRPIGSENVDTAGAQIPGRVFHIPNASEPATVFSDAELAWLTQNDPRLAMQVVMMTNAQRAELKQIIAAGRAALDPNVPRAEAPAASKGRRPMSAEARKAAGDRLRAIRARKQAEKAAAEQPS